MARELGAGGRGLKCGLLLQEFFATSEQNEVRRAETGLAGGRCGDVAAALPGVQALPVGGGVDVECEFG